MQGGVCRSKARLDGKTVLITGANTGIGLATAKDLAKRGARVLIACRNKEKGEIALEVIRDFSGNSNIALYVLDLSSLESVRHCASQINSKEQRLDVLINNAGAMWVSHRRTVDGFEMHLGTNHLGHFLFTNLLLDLIKKSAPSRIINVSAGGHKLIGTIRFEDIHLEKNFSAFHACLQSKLANILFTVELSERLQGSNVTVNCLHPGVVDTEMTRLIDDASLIVRIMFKVLFYITFKPFIKTPMAGAQTSIYLAVDPDVANITGKYFSDCRLDTPSDAAQDKVAAARLWTLSSQMVGLNQS